MGGEVAARGVASAAESTAGRGLESLFSSTQAPWQPSSATTPSASDASAAAQAEARAVAEMERRRVEEENVAKRQAKDKRIAEDAQKRQSAHRQTSPRSRPVAETSAWQRMREDLDNATAQAAPTPAAGIVADSTPMQSPETPGLNPSVSRSNAVPAAEPLQQGYAPLDRSAEVIDANDEAEAPKRTFATAGTETPGNASPWQEVGSEEAYSRQQASENARQDDAGRAAESGQNQQPKPDDAPPLREQIDEFWKRASKERQTRARQVNTQAYAQWRARNPVGTRKEYEMSDEFVDDAEEFAYTLGSIVREHYKSFDDSVLNEEGEIDNAPAVSIGTEVKDTLKQDRLIDNVVRAFKLGFFHVGTERLETDGSTGRQTLRWGRPVENGIKLVCEYLGMDPKSLDGQRTVFRLVTLYCSMGFDRNGKMFNQGRDEWSMTEKEFADACNMIYRSCVEHGNPLIPPRRTSYGTATLRGTEIIPSGVLPKAVAQAITGEDSRLRINGVKPTAAGLIENCRQEWVTRTYPYIKTHLVSTPDRGGKKTKKEKVTLDDGRTAYVDTGETDEGRNLVAQRIAIEDMQQALARLDNMDANAFSAGYDVDTRLHYTIEEYRNSSIQYATAMNGLYDADAVDEFQRRLLEKVEQDVRDNHSREVRAVSVVANTIVGCIRSNALFLNVPIAGSALVEKKVGNIQTDWAIRSLSRYTSGVAGVSRIDVSQELRDAFRTDEGHQAISGALLIMDAAGPGAFNLFSQTGMPLTQENAERFIREQILPSAATEGAAKAQEIQRKMQRWQQKIMTGDLAFRGQDAMNFLNALLTVNQVHIGMQRKLAKHNKLDQHAGQAFIGEEFDDIFLANNSDISRFMAEVIGTPAGRDAMMMMRANNIGNFNPVGYTVDKYLRSHGVKNAMITTFLDSFPKYGINFLYALAPFSRSFTYLEMKHREANGDLLAGTYTIGGGFADVSDLSNKTRMGFFKEAIHDPAFRAGLRMNLMFDAMTFARWSITTILLGGVMAMLGFEPPDHDEDFGNISMWKIGGQEIQLAYWLNDLTQLGLPGAYGLAAVLSGQPVDVAFGLTMSSLYDQVDGNVVMDFIKGVKSWGDEIEVLEKMGNDPQYKPEFDPSFGVMELMLDAADKLVPGAPLYRYMSRNSAWRGAYADDPSPYKVWDKSDEWAIENKVTKNIDDPNEIMLRRHSTSNWLLAAYLDFANGILFNPSSDQTGYFWWEMPPKGMQDQMVLTWAHSQNMDYTNREGCTTDEAYEELKTDQLLAQINSVIDEYGGINQAVYNGYFISNDIRRAAQRTIARRIAQLEDERQALHDGRENWEKDWDAINAYKDLISEQWEYMNLLKNKNIPSWGDNSYRQIIGDTEITFTHEDGTPALGWEWLFDFSGSVTAEYKHKGNHPWAVAPVTFVDYSSNEIVQRGFSGETVPFWAIEGENGGIDNEAIRAGIGQETIPMGRDAGKVLNDVLYGDFLNGVYQHPDLPTVGRRGLVPNEMVVPKDILTFDVQAAIDEYRSKKGEAADGSGEDDDGDGTTNYRRSSNTSYGRRYYSTAYPSRVYTYSSRSGSSSYNPKIYSTKVSSTRISNTRSSNTRTGSGSRSVNSDRADTMNTRSPQSPGNRTFLRPGFSTKGSREAYKRQDI